MEYKVGSRVLNDWQIIKLIGEGANGKVFEIQKSDFGVTTKSALKVITIPKSMSDVKAAMTEGMDEKSVTEYFRGFVQDIVKEIAIMSELKGHSNIVSYEDHCVILHEESVGWDILIRMELLTPMSDYLLSHTMTEKEVIQLGCDMCNALDYCQKKGLIHRDIKPENIFVNEEGRFKLGDFGIARAVEKTMGGLSKKGTESYMAPEVYLGKPYGATVDIYSVGLVLYKLLNNNRLPFLPPAGQPIRFEDRENALIQRMSGKEKIPAPSIANDKLSKVVLKACAFETNDRYQTAVEMLDALNDLILNKKTEDKPLLKVEVEIEEEKTMPAEKEELTVCMEKNEDTSLTMTEYFRNKVTECVEEDEVIEKENADRRENKKREKKTRKWVVVFCVVLCVLTCIGCYIKLGHSCSNCEKILIGKSRNYDLANDKLLCKKCFNKKWTCQNCGFECDKEFGEEYGWYLLEDGGVCPECTEYYE